MTKSQINDPLININLQKKISGHRAPLAGDPGHELAVCSCSSDMKFL